MTVVRALPRLLWRPAILWMLFPLFWAIAWPVLTLAEGGTPVGWLLGSAGDGSGAAAAADGLRTARWHLTLLVPAAIGLTVTVVRLELQHAAFSWMLPGLRRDLLAGTLLIAVPLGAVMAWVVTGGGGAAVSATGAAAFGVAILSFTLVAAGLDAAIARTLRWTALLALILAAVQPATFARMVEAHPVIGLAASLVWVTALLYLQFSKPAARTRPFRWSAVATGATTLYWAGRSGVDRDWKRSLATARIGPWLRAAEYEGSRGRSLSFPASSAVAAAFAAILAHTMSAPGMILVFAGVFLWIGRLQLTSTLPYPLSRARRARLAALGMFIEATLLIALIALALFILRAIDLPLLPWAEDPTRELWAPAVAMAWACSPIALWVNLRRPDYQTSGPKALDFIPWMIYALVGSFAIRQAADLEPLALAALTTAIAVPLHLLLWGLVHRHYTTADLA